MKRMLLLAVLLASAAPARGGVIGERWGGKDAACTHPGTLKVTSDADGARLVFDLSVIPAGAKVHHASLFAYTRDNRQPTNPAVVTASETLGEDDSPLKPKTFKLEAPYYRSFDVTEAVKVWVAHPKRNAGFRVRLDGILAAKSLLEVRYERPDGKVPNVPEQVTGLRALHHDGQTFLVWRELKHFQPPAGSVFYVDKFSRKGNKVAKAPGKGFGGLARVPAITLKTLRDLQGMELRDKPSGFQGIKAARQVRKVADLQYRIYRHTAPITAKTIHEARWVGVGRPLSAYDKKMAVITFKGEYIDQKEVGSSIIPTSCVAGGKPVAAGEAIFVHNPSKAGKAYYAVTAVLAGTENLSEITDANSTAKPVVEALDPPRPVLQRLQEIQYGADVVEKWYMFWAAPPYANLPSRPLHVLVGEPTKTKPPYPMVIDGFHGGFNIVGALRVPARGALTLLIENQVGYGGDGHLLYNEGLGTLRSFRECKVRYFSEKYFLRVIDWALATWKIDRARVVGGQHDSGPLHVGVRHPEIFKRIFLGNYTASYEYTWSPPSRGLATVLGPRDLAKTPDGHCAWDVLDLSWYLAQNPGRDIPLIWGGSNTGKDAGHTSEFGWQDDPRGWAALGKFRQPFAIAWGVGGADPGGSQGYRSMAPELSRLLGSRAWTTTYPAFSSNSLDNNPGNGDPAEGDTCGQINGFVLWEDQGHQDAPDAWAMTIRLARSCPEDACTVDVTPRHCTKFKPRKGQTFAWTNAPVKSGPAIQSGTVAADRWGLVTVKGVKVTKAGHRISIRRK